jgi:hypothetical protein
MPAVGVNVGDLAETSDDDVSFSEGHNLLTNTPHWLRRGHVFRHDRRASVWVLVAKVAAWVAEATDQAMPNNPRGDRCSGNPSEKIAA